MSYLYRELEMNNIFTIKVSLWLLNNFINCNIYLTDGVCVILTGNHQIRDIAHQSESLSSS